MLSIVTFPSAKVKFVSVNASAYQIHFGAESTYLSEKTRESVDKGLWNVKRRKEKLGTAVEQVPEGYVTQNLSEDASVRAD